MKIESTRFGTLDLPDEAAIDFGPGLLGFPDGQRYVVVEIEDDDDYFWLQSVELADVAFLATHPWGFFPDYELDVPDEVQAEIGLDDPVDSAVFLLITTHHDGEELVDVTANLLGPIVANTRTKQARQLVLDEGRYSTRASLVAP